MNQSVFVMNRNDVLRTSMRQFLSVIIDFTSPNALTWFTDQLETFAATPPLDRIWLNMNEPLTTMIDSVNLTTTEQRQEPFSIIVALDDNGKASGMLYWDHAEYQRCVQHHSNEGGGQRILECALDD